MLRSSSKRIRAEFDAMYDQKRWWLLIHERFIPNITGLSSDLKTVDYLRILKQYFAPIRRFSVIESLSIILPTVLMLSNNEGSNSLLKDQFITFMDDELSHTAQGRAHLLMIIRILDRLVHGPARDVVNTLGNFVVYSFCVDRHCVIRTRALP
jgi:hypothetical protein